MNQLEDGALFRIDGVKIIESRLGDHERGHSDNSDGEASGLPNLPLQHNASQSIRTILRRVMGNGATGTRKLRLDRRLRGLRRCVTPTVDCRPG